MNNISVCIPFYNTSKYLHECLKYILNDDFVSEIIISDDCSTDNTWNILQKYKDHKKLILNKNKNKNKSI